MKTAFVYSKSFGELVMSGETPPGAPFTNMD